MDDRAEVRQPLLQYQHQDPTGETGAHGKAGGCRNTGASRRPLVALREAYGIAMKRGQVMPVSEGRCDYFHLILFTENRVTFIKVKRTLTEISDPKEILQNYEREIRHLARVPLNTVYTREFWVRSPRRTSFFFN